MVSSEQLLREHRADLDATIYSHLNWKNPRWIFQSHRLPFSINLQFGPSSLSNRKVCNIVKYIYFDLSAVGGLTLIPCWAFINSWA